jgi:hypothetical protein
MLSSQVLYHLSHSASPLCDFLKDNKLQKEFESLNNYTNKLMSTHYIPFNVLSCFMHDLFIQCFHIYLLSIYLSKVLENTSRQNKNPCFRGAYIPVGRKLQLNK